MYGHMRLDYTCEDGPRNIRIIIEVGFIYVITQEI